MDKEIIDKIHKEKILINKIIENSNIKQIIFGKNLEIIVVDFKETKEKGVWTIIIIEDE